MKRYAFPLAIVAVIFGTFYSIIDSWPTISVLGGSMAPMLMGKETFYQKQIAKTLTVNPPARIIESVEDGHFGDSILALEIGAMKKSEGEIIEIKKPTTFFVISAYQHIPDFSLKVVDYCILTNPEDISMRFNMPCNELDKAIAVVK